MEEERNTNMKETSQKIKYYKIKIDEIEKKMNILNKKYSEIYDELNELQRKIEQEEKNQITL